MRCGRNFRSPLLWDVFAVGTYATVSVLFWYMGMVPDIATFRDRAKTKIRQFAYGVSSLGWTGSASQWQRLREGLHDAGRVGHAAGAVGAHDRVVSTSPLAKFLVGTRRSSRRTSWRCDFQRLRHGAHAADSGRANCLA